MSPKKLNWIAAVRFVLLLCAVAVAQPASAYQRYKSGCNTCHGSFTANPYRPSGGAAWPNSLHTVHRNSSYMGTACGYCHKGGDGNNPYLNSSDGAGATSGYGCIGCHGSSASGAPNGNGLLRHHAAANVTTCAGCHSNVGAAPPEDTDPPYYGTASTKVSHPCNDDSGTSEDWSGDGAGLDNDGDMLVDGNDPDCQSSTCGNGVVDQGETCDPPSTCPASCDDGNACTADTLTGSAQNCNAACASTPITACAGGDGCCPAGCLVDTDSDCQDHPTASDSCGCAATEPASLAGGMSLLAWIGWGLRRRRTSRPTR